jgi:M6 family metalloprotease-like protein
LNDLVRMRFGDLLRKIQVLFLLLSVAVVTGVRAQDHLRICAIRVEFQADDNDLTTGNGKFIYDSSGVTLNTVDPPPHDRSYFQDQLIAVKNYFTTASKGKLIVSGDVYPLGRKQAYQLPHDMGYYNPNTTTEENDLQISQLFADAIEAADNDPDLHFADYDVVAVFHAGVGKDIDLGFDETPQDIPSLYITPAFLKRNFGQDFSGISVDEGTLLIDRGMLLPETESQQGFELALTGIFAANIGSHIGLYDLFSPSTQRSGIGTFGLMDSGLFNMFGLSPAMPCAFSRMLLDWDAPVKLRDPASSLRLHRFEGRNDPDTTIYRVDINSSEYYLVEYRGERQVNVDSVLYALSDGRENLPTYLEVLRTYLPDRITISDSTGVLLKIDDYDWGLPGSGILIWHIDQSVIDEKGPENMINDDRNNRAVDLEEADGSQDIGYSYTLVEPGFQSELGTWLDFWFNGNPSPLYHNEFSGKSSPNSRSNRNLALSNITLSDFSDNLTPVMTFSYDRDFFVSGFPVILDPDSSGSPTGDLYFIDVESAGKPAVFIQNDLGDIYAVADNGKGLFDPHILRIVDGDAAGRLRIAFADTNTNGVYDMLFTVTDGGRVAGYRLDDENIDGLPDLLFTVDLNRAVTAAPVTDYPYLYVGTEPDLIYRMHFDGSIDQVYETDGVPAGFTVLGSDHFTITAADPQKPGYAPVLIDLDSDGLQDTVSFESRKNVRLRSSSLDRLLSTEEPVTGPPAFGDFDQDGSYEIFLTGEKRLYAFHSNGAMVANFPLAPVLPDDEHLTGTALVLDVDGDNQCDVLCATDKGQVFAYDGKGSILTGFPFSTGAAMTGSLAAGDIDGDQIPELFASNGTALYAWKLSSTGQEAFTWWLQAMYNATNNQVVRRFLERVPSGVTELLPASKAYVYPNPNIEDYTNIRYYLKDDATVRINIFDLAGDLVAQFNGPGEGSVDNEVRWQLNGISSGVYLCRIEATSDRDQAFQIIKIMVIK